MSKFEEHPKVLEMLKKSQDADEDNRDAGREAHLFVDKRDGQWEPYWWNANENRPRYSFDMTSPIVDIISGGMDQADFNVSVRPASGDASKDDAKLLDGMIRNIENVSSASDIYSLSGRGGVIAGLDGWQVKQKFVDDDSFDQDLVIEPIANFIDSVWFGPFKKPDASDAPWAVVLEAMDKEEYEEKYPEGSGMSVSDGRMANAYHDKDEQIVIANIYYIEKKPRELLKMASGRILEAEAAKDILDELKAEGDTVLDIRNRPKNIVHSRLFDGGGWLNEPQTTVFNAIPVIPVIVNFKIFENKLLYRGVVEKLMDAQRVYNYSKSRQIEEGALAPRAKYWLTTTQIAGHEDTLATLNTNSDPVQTFTPDQMNPGTPTQTGGAQINPGLATISQDMQQNINQNAGLFSASVGDNPGLQSGVAIQKLQDKGDTGTIKYTKAMERAICRTARILVDSIPTVYSGERQMRIIGQDGSFDMKPLNQSVMDEETGKMITVNDVSKGKYDVTCTAGPSFQNQQQETVSAITEIAAVDPSAIQVGADILFNNLTSPGMDLLAERKRQQLFQAGIIPFTQMTDEEKQQFEQAQQQEQAPDAGVLLAQAEMEKAAAAKEKNALDGQVQLRIQDREDTKVSLSAQSQAAKLDQDQQKFDFTQMLEIQKQQLEQQKAITAQQKTLADTMKTLREAMGMESVVSPAGQAAFDSAAQETNASLNN